MDSKEKKTSTWHEIKETLKKAPKLLKYIIIVLLALALSSTGVMINTIFQKDGKTIKFGLENVGELITQKAHLTIIEDTKVHREFFQLFEIPWTESRQIFSYDVEVDASVNFDQISYHINDEKKVITVELPHSRIYKTILDINSLKVYLDEESLFSRIDLQKHNEAMIEMTKRGEEDAKNNGLLSAADENAQKLIEGFIRSNRDYRNYQIIYKYIGE